MNGTNCYNKSTLEETDENNLTTEMNRLYIRGWSGGGVLNNSSDRMEGRCDPYYNVQQESRYLTTTTSLQKTVNKKRLNEYIGGARSNASDDGKLKGRPPINTKSNGRICGTRTVCLQWSCYTAEYEKTEYGDDRSFCGSTKFQCERDLKRDYIMTKYTNLWKNYVNRKRTVINATNGTAKKMHKTSNPNPLIVCNNSCRHHHHRPKTTIEQSEQIDTDDFRNLDDEKKKSEFNCSELEKLRNETEECTKLSRNTLQQMLNTCDKTLQQRARYALQNIGQSVVRKTNDVVDYKTSWEQIAKMEMRAEERKRRWDVIRENKKRLEETKLTELEMKREENRRRIQREKKEKLLELKRKKLKEEESKRKQAEEREQAKRMNNIATEYYRRKLLADGLKNLHELVLHRRRLYQKAELFRERNLLSKCFSKIKIYRRISIDNKIEKSVRFYNKLILRKYFDGFKQVHREYRRNVEAANNMYNFKLLKNSYYTWKLFIYKQRYADKLRQREMDTYYNRKLLERCFGIWKNYKHVLFEEREKEKRLRIWRNKVQEALPDFEH